MHRLGVSPKTENFTEFQNINTLQDFYKIFRVQWLLHVGLTINNGGFAQGVQQLWHVKVGDSLSSKFSVPPAATM